MTIDNVVNEIQLQITETADNFIFMNISKYAKYVFKIVIPKDLLVDALNEYKNKHPEEWECRIKATIKAEED